MFTSVVFQCDGKINDTRGTLTLCKVRAPLALYFAAAGLLFLEPTGLLTVVANAGLLSISGLQIEFKATGAIEPTLERHLGDRRIQQEAKRILQIYLDKAISALRKNLGEDEGFDVEPLSASLDASVSSVTREVSEFSLFEDVIRGAPMPLKLVRRELPVFEVKAMILLAKVTSRDSKSMDFYKINMNDFSFPRVESAPDRCLEPLEGEARAL